MCKPLCAPVSSCWSDLIMLKLFFDSIPSDYIGGYSASDDCLAMIHQKRLHVSFL